MTAPVSLAQLVVAACLDVGSVMSGGVGWALRGPSGLSHGSDLVELVRAVSGVLLDGGRVALGFECPLYVPRRADPRQLACQRIGEAGLNWCGGPGAAVLATGLVQVNWVLSRLAECDRSLRATTRWGEFGPSRLFVWEAFITSKHGDFAVMPADLPTCSLHERDAVAGLVVFTNRVLLAGNLRSDLGAEPAISLIGLHLLMTGLSDDRSLLEETCLVVRARKPQ